MSLPGATVQGAGLRPPGGPGWPRWAQLPRESRDTLFLLAVIGWTVMPHAQHLPAWCSALTGAVLFWRGKLALRQSPLPGRIWLVAVLLAVIGLTFWSHHTLAGKEAGVTLLVALVALKTLELRARRDAFVVFFLGFFLVLTHFLYSQSLPVAAASLVSVWGLLTALVLAHMPVGQPALGRAARLAARFALLGAPVMVLLFLLFPRVAPLWGVPGDAGARTGLSGEMRVGMIAELASDDSIAMRLRVVSGPRPEPRSLYFRGPVLGGFDGSTWRMTQPSFPLQLRPARNLRTEGAPVRLEVTLEPLRLKTLPVLEATPALPTIEGLRLALREDLQWVSDRPVTERLRFTAEAWPSFGHGPTEPVVGLQDYLELPPGFNPRTLAWAAALRRDPAFASADGRALADALMRHIRTAGFSYTLTPGVYDEAERGTAIDEFWLDRKAGFCEHFASAFVVIMRALDVPARVVTGYQGAEANPVDGTLVVRQSFAHAWAEYWMPGTGWVRADPTAAIAPDRIDRSRPLQAPPGLVAGAFEGVAPGLLVQLRALWESVDNRWNQWVLNYSRGSQYALLRNLGVESPDWEDLGLLLGGCVGVAGAAIALGSWWRQGRRDPWLRAWARVRVRAEALGLPGGPHLAPRALAEGLRRSVAGLHGGGAPLAAQQAIDALLALEVMRYGRVAAAPGPGIGPSADAAARRVLLALRNAELVAHLAPAASACASNGHPVALAGWRAALDRRLLPSLLVSMLLAAGLTGHEPAQGAPASRHGSTEPEAVTYGRREDLRELAASIAVQRSLDPVWVEETLAQARFQPAIARLMLPPPAGTAKNWAAYRSRFVEPRRIAAGVAFWQAQRPWLIDAERRYGVPAAIVVGIVGVETIYGQQMGRFRVLDALTTLSLDFPAGARRDRSAFFREELGDFLSLCRRQGLDPLGTLGSYAGAMGMPQFMPSALQRHAVDFDGDGRIDLQGSAADVIGSVAHYLADHGWQAGMATHHTVAVPVDAADRALLLGPDIVPSFTPAEFAARGARLDGAGQRHTGLLALVELQNGDAAPSYVAGTANFYAITRYNWSSYYAMAVIELGAAVEAAADGLGVTGTKGGVIPAASAARAPARRIATGNAGRDPRHPARPPNRGSP